MWSRRRCADLPAGQGLNAATGEYVDLIAAGIIDPAKVTRSALQNAASIAALFLTTEAVIADKPEKAAADARRWRRRHGRHGLLSPARNTLHSEGRSRSGGRLFARARAMARRRVSRLELRASTDDRLDGRVGTSPSWAGSGRSVGQSAVDQPAGRILDQ